MSSTPDAVSETAFSLSNTIHWHKHMHIDITQTPLPAGTIRERAQIDNAQVIAWASMSCAAVGIALLTTAYEYRFIFWAAIFNTVLGVFWAAQGFNNRPYASIDAIMRGQLPTLAEQSPVVARYLEQVQAQQRELTCGEFKTLREYIYTQREQQPVAASNHM